MTDQGLYVLIWGYGRRERRAGDGQRRGRGREKWSIGSDREVGTEQRLGRQMGMERGRRSRER